MKTTDSINSVHVVAEITVIGAMAAYFHKRVNGLENELRELKTQMVQLNRNFIYRDHETHTSDLAQGGTRLGGVSSNSTRARETEDRGSYHPWQDSDLVDETPSKEWICNKYKCRLSDKRKVVISKISEQVEFGDGSASELDESCAGMTKSTMVSTFSVPCSPNQVLKSVTPSLDADVFKRQSMVRHESDDDPTSRRSDNVLSDESTSRRVGSPSNDRSVDDVQEILRLIDIED